MITRFAAAVLAAASLGGCAHRAVFGPPLCDVPIARWLECRASGPESVRVGEPVRLRFTLRNVSPHSSYRVLGISTPWGPIGHDDVLVVRREGRIVEHDTLELSGAGPRSVPMSAYLVLGPSEAITATVDLATAGYTLVEPGRYEVDASGYLEDLHEGPRLERASAGTAGVPGMQRAVRDFHPAVILCDRIALTILPPDDALQRSAK